MQKNKLGNTGFLVSPVSFGTLTMGPTQMHLPIDEGANLIVSAFKKGINLFDTAEYYDTYLYVKKALQIIKKEKLPSAPIISTKSLVRSYQDMEYSIINALKEMNIKTIDIFLLHEIRQDPDWEMRDGAWECLKDYKEKGIIKAIGISTHHVDVTEKMADIPECDIVFPLINYASLGIRNGSTYGTCEDMAAAIKRCHDNGKGIYAMKAFGGGNLTGEYTKALNYVSSLPGIDSITIGIGKTEELDRLIEYAEKKLSEDYTPDISYKKVRIDIGDCERCGACLNRCPNKAIYENRFGEMTINEEKCLKCGYCAPVCPVRAIVMF